MKAIKVKKFSKFISPVVVLLFITLFFQSYPEKLVFLNSSVVPSAQGTVEIKIDDNNNYAIEISITRLASPKRLDPPKKVYVVWINTEKNGAINIGQLNTSTTLLSSTLKSSLKTVTAFKPAGFFITAEDVGNIKQPTGKVVMKTGSKPKN